ncbi:uncharacterized protein LOC143220690 [Lasioglossum baleicum]|uniref:uncharacterized protein LOC143220690 n=1 Tax=Lasioglossum baleicum TaxID=434251 RepID=UPI003FCDB075
MSSFVVPRLHGLTLFIWIVSILTSSVGDEIKTDGTTPSASNNVSVGNNDRTLSSMIDSTLKPVGSPQIYVGKHVTSSFMGEGGPISIKYTTQPVSSTSSYLAGSSDNLSVKNNLATGKDDLVIAAKRNPALSKIVPRKGAINMLNDEMENISTEKVILEKIKSVVESSTTTVTHNSEHTYNHLNDSKLTTSDKKKNISNVTTSSTLQPNTSVSLQQDVTSSTTITTTLLREHKAKPTVTIGEPNNDKRSFVSPTRLRSGFPKRIDYVFQVIIALIALPALGAILFIVYKQGRDCWEKRHYRRMDFLIDGMYND